MPFVAECPRHGPLAEGDCSDNAIFLSADVLHLELDESGRATCFERVTTRALDIRRRAFYVPGISPNERPVVWRNPRNDQIRYPGRNDAVMPAHYASVGYERHELPSLRAIEKFENQQGVRSEAAWYDRGSGRGFDEGTE